LEIGIEPTARHATDLGFIPVLLADGCGSEKEAAGARSIEKLRFLGQTVVPDVDTFSELLVQRRSEHPA
jgi:nicotinamidase-related amidase